MKWKDWLLNASLAINVVTFFYASSYFISYVGNAIDDIQVIPCYNDQIQDLPQFEPTSNHYSENSMRCFDREKTPRRAQRGSYWVLYNHVRGTKNYHCNESITYTTHADVTFLDNIEPLLERWQGPISLALYAPGTDFTLTLTAIHYLRECGSPLVKELVSFHLYFPDQHFPKESPKLRPPDCSDSPPWIDLQGSSLYKAQNKLTYPVNVGRNIARESATTHYILPSDIELYPSPGIIPRFLDMILRDDPPLATNNRNVFPLHIFEIESDASLPENKTHLVEMLQSGTAIPFHKQVCPSCHNVPHAKEWTEAPQTDGLHVFFIGKRLGNFARWEPIYIGTHADPLYDERLSWEGKSDKMTQGYALCALDYDFLILDNAFLVHKPGIKTVREAARASQEARTNQLIRTEIIPQLKLLYGTREGCSVW